MYNRVIGNKCSIFDGKCAKIDVIIKKQQAVIEKLKAYEMSVITEAVTKGLNPNAEMKDNGVVRFQSIGVCKKIKYATKIMRGKFNHRQRHDSDYYDGQYSFCSNRECDKSFKIY